MRSTRGLALLVALLAWPAAAQDSTGAQTEDAPGWSFSPSLYFFVVPDARDYLNPNLAVDRGGLHLEARYNYEAFEAGSAWIGWNFAVGEELTLEVTPMLGGVFGSISGIAPGWLLSLAYRDFSLYSQGEYFIEPSDSAENFLYTWSELDWSPVEWFRTGLAIQRTKAYESSLNIDRGLLVGFSYRYVEVTGYVFDVGASDPLFVLGVAAAL